MTADSPDSTPTPNPAPVPPKRRPKNKRRPNIPGVDHRAYVESSAARHQARVLAMQSLFEWDLTERDPQEILVRLRGEDAAELPESAQSTADEDEGQFDDIPQPVAERAIALFSGVLEYQGEIDPVIEKAAPQFPIPQIAAIDRNVLRMAIFELRHATDVPYKVVINEAVEIAKRFGGPNSGRFVNGVLGTISRGLTEERRAT